MDILRYEGDLHALLKWAVNRVESVDTYKTLPAPPEGFIDWVTALMPENCRETLGHWISSHTADSPHDGEWARGYPHNHITSVGWDPDATTVLTYLITESQGGEIAVGGLNKDDPYEIIAPEPGMAVRVDARTWHGVRAVRGGGRIALGTTGFPSTSEL